MEPVDVLDREPGAAGAGSPPDMWRVADGASWHRDKAGCLVFVPGDSGGRPVRMTTLVGETEFLALLRIVLAGVSVDEALGRTTISRGDWNFAARALRRLDRAGVLEAGD
jgi:hypothetical protein